MSFLNLGPILVRGNVLISLYSGWISLLPSMLTKAEWHEIFVKELVLADTELRCLAYFLLCLVFASTFFVFDIWRCVLTHLLPWNLYHAAGPSSFSHFTSHRKWDPDQFAVGQHTIVQGKQVAAFCTIPQWNTCSLGKNTLVLSSPIIILWLLEVV